MEAWNTSRLHEDRPFLCRLVIKRAGNMLPYIDIRELLVRDIMGRSRLMPVQLFSMGRLRLGLQSMNVRNILKPKIQRNTDSAQ